MSNGSDGSIVLTFIKDKETKGTWRFSEVLADGQERGTVGSIYVLKARLAELGDPETLIITISS